METLLYTSHLYERMIGRDIGWPTIEAVARSGEVVETHPDGVRKMELCGYIVVIDGEKLVTVYRDEAREPKPRPKRKKQRREEFKADWIRGRRVNVRLTNHYLGMMER